VCRVSRLSCRSPAGKFTLYEGGLRVPAFVHAPARLPAAVRGTWSKAIFSVVDWLPTIVGGVLESDALAGADQMGVLSPDLTLSLSHSLFRSFTLCRSLSLSVALSHSLPLSLSFSLAIPRSLSLSLALSRSLSLSPALSRSLSLSFALFSLSLSLALSRSRSLSLSPALSRSLLLSLVIARSLFDNDGTVARSRRLCPTGTTLDGVDQWASLRGEASAPPRDELLYNIDSYNNTPNATSEWGRSERGFDGLSHVALRQGRWKLLHEVNQTWWPVPTSDAPAALDPDAMAVVDDVVADVASLPLSAYAPITALFDLEADLEERHDVAAEHPEIVARLRDRIRQYVASMARATYCNDGTHRSVAYSVWNEKYDGFVGPWMDDPHYMSKCRERGAWL